MSVFWRARFWFHREDSASIPLISRGMRGCDESKLRTSRLVALAVALVFVAFVSTARANTSQITAVPDGIPTNGVTGLQTCRLTAPADTVVSLEVTDPSGSVWTHAASVGQAIPSCPTIYDVNFGGASLGWASNDADVTQTDEPGQYHVVVFYTDGSRNNATFDASAFFSVPEFGSILLPVAAGFAGLVGIKRLRKK